MIKLMMQYHVSHGGDTWVITVNPRHRDFYTRAMGYTALGPPRRYAAVEAVKVGHGGISYVAKLFGCDPETVRHGQEDLGQLPDDEAEGRVRKKGGPEAS